MGDSCEGLPSTNYCSISKRRPEVGEGIRAIDEQSVARKYVHQYTGREKPRILAARRALRSWFNKNGRLFPWRESTCSPYELVLAEVLLQRTRAETVAAFLPGFITRYRSWRRLSQANHHELEVLLSPLGLSRRRATALRALSKALVEQACRIPRTQAGLMALPGVGQYIANAILVMVYVRPAPLLDPNMARVLERCFGPRQLADIRHDPRLQQLSLALVRCKDTRRINLALLDLGAIVCVPRSPRCTICPLRRLCLYRRLQRWPSKAVAESQ